MKLNLGNSHTARRRLDDLRYLPADVAKRARSARERGLAAWAGYGPGQRLSSLGLALAVIVALVVVVTGGGEGGLNLVVTDEQLAASDGSGVTTAPRQGAEAGPSSSVDDTAAPATSEPDARRSYD